MDGSGNQVGQNPSDHRAGRSNGKQGFEYEEHGDDAFGLYQIRIDLAPQGFDRKTLQSITFKKGAGDSTAGIFAISGERSKSTASRVETPRAGVSRTYPTGGNRIVYRREGQKTFTWQQPQAAFAVPGIWANVDGHVLSAGLGI